MEFLNKKVFPVLFVLTGLFILIFFFVHQYYLIKFPYQLEYREGAICFVVDLMRNGKNFYDFDLQPQATYVYGIGYPFVVYLFSFISEHILIAARIVTTLSMVLTMLIVFKTIVRRKNGYYEAFAAIGLLAPALIYNTNLGFPHALAMLLMVTAIYIPWRLNFTYWSVFTSIIVSIFAFASKPYGIIMAGILLGYLFLFESKRKAVITGGFFLVVLISIVLIFNAYFQAYFIDTFKSFACVPYMSIFSHAIRQVKMFFFANYYFCITIAFFLYFLSDRNSFDSISSVKINLKEFDKPFLVSTSKPDYFGIVSVFSFILFVGKLGHHVGTDGGLYLYHIFYPFFLIWMVKTDSIIFKPLLKNLLWTVYISISAVSFYNYYISDYFMYKIFSVKYKAAEERVLTYKNILGSQNITSLLVENKRPVFNSGQSEYFSDAARCSSEAEKIMAEFEIELNKQISTQSFDLILKTQGDNGYNAIQNDTLIKYYAMKEYQEFMGRQLEFWERIKASD
jgi:hypothetical protein